MCERSLVPGHHRARARSLLAVCWLFHALPRNGRTLTSCLRPRGTGGVANQHEAAVQEAEEAHPGEEDSAFPLQQGNISLKAPLLIHLSTPRFKRGVRPAAATASGAPRRQRLKDGNEKAPFIGVDWVYYH